VSDRLKPVDPRRILKRAAGLGAIAGLAGVYLSVVGIVERFETRNVVTGVAPLGLLTVAIAILVAAYVAARPPRNWGMTEPARGHKFMASLLTGAAAGLVLVLFLLAVGALDLRDIFPNTTPGLVRILSLGIEGPAGWAALMALCLSLGAVAGALHQLRPRDRQPLIAAMAAVLLMSLMEPFLNNVFLQLRQNALASFIYQRSGLTIPAAVIVFLVVLAVSAFQTYRGAATRRRVAALPENTRRSATYVALFLVGLLLLVLPHLMGVFLSEVVGTVGLYILMGLGLNIVVGYAGLLDLGYVAFFAVGAYATALLTSPVSSLGLGMDFWMALPIVIIVAAITGIIIGAPVLRLRGDYLAIVTLGFGEIVRILLLSDALRPIFGGAQGILAIPPPVVGDLRLAGPINLYYPILAFVVLGAFVAWTLANSRIGRAWNAMREDEEVAAATGINTTNYKLLAFAIGAVFGCVAGAFFAVKIGIVFPQRLDLLVSITVLSLIILGGMGSIRGVILGAFVLVGLPELLREFAEYRLLIYGGVLVAMMLLRPEGLLPNRSRQRELHDDDDSAEVQYQRRVGTETGAPAISAP